MMPSRQITDAKVKSSCHRSTRIWRTAILRQHQMGISEVGVPYGGPYYKGNLLLGSPLFSETPKWFPADLKRASWGVGMHWLNRYAAAV